ncbi:hypothetical protein BJX61DRAFT_254332 [Aspergillus egyptiacus]|nr:hypothetical protein BJX61DRAFT_254332 [Aspergillus egyptiacus]
MGQRGRDRRTKTNTDHFHTPEKPGSSTKLKRAPATLGSLAVTPAPSSASSTALASRSWKRNSTRSVADQPTLTQIDFVTVSQSHDTDNDIDYVGESTGNPREVIEIEDDGEDEVRNDDEDDADYRPSSTSRSKTARVALEHCPSKKKASDLNDGVSKKGRRRGGDTKGKVPQKDDKTLTQMNYVQRVLIEPDEDVKLEYAYITPNKKASKRQKLKDDDAGAVQQQLTYTPEPSNEHKRRRLSHALDSKELQKPESNGDNSAVRAPITPRKPLKAEIPSSQSPESPGVAFITSSQFRSATRSPQKPAFEAISEPPVKRESSNLNQPHGAHRTTGMTPAPDHEPSHNDLQSPPSSRTQERSTNATPKPNDCLKHVDEAVMETPTSRQRHGTAPTQRTVIYETDAESVYSDFQDDKPDVPSSPHGKGNANSDDYVEEEGAPEPQTVESQELPPLPPSEQEVESVPLPSQSNLLSDASICYQRIHQATQFPLEPVPTLNTQKMAELFPEESSGLHTLTPLSQPSSPVKTAKAMPGSQPQLVDQDQYESQEADRVAAEVIPESSPVARHTESASSNRPGSPARDVVVQVESSQPVDRIYKNRTAAAGSGPRGFLSRSQILTSSVMESVPIPAFWMSSQDTVGEPYSLPDT